MKRANNRRFQNLEPLIFSACRTLVPIDSEPLKRFEQKKCQGILNRMDLARANLRRFNETSQPAFKQWFHLTFGREITELRERDLRRDELRGLICEIEEYMACSRCSYYQAYEAVMLRRANAETVKAEDPFSDDWEKDWEEKWEEKWNEDRHARSDETGSPESETLADSPDIQPPETRLKDLYRALARKLHPDVNTEIDQKRKDLWYEVQAAYEARDIERLETLSAMSNIYDGQFERGESVWSLKSLHRDLQSGLRRLQRQINQLKHEPAWNFEALVQEPDRLAKTRTTLARQLRADLETLETAVRYGEDLIESWKNPPAKRTPQPTPRPQRGRSRGWSKAEMDRYTGF